MTWGWKMIVTEQLAPTARLEPHVLAEMEKSPLTVMLVIAGDVLPVLVIETIWCALAVPSD